MLFQCAFALQKEPEQRDHCNAALQNCIGPVPFRKLQSHICKENERKGQHSVKFPIGKRKAVPPVEAAIFSFVQSGIDYYHSSLLNLF